MELWAVLGSWGCREKNPNCHKYATFEVSLLCFQGKKKHLIFFENIVAPEDKIGYRLILK